jgi:hypothetical protein
VLGKTTADVANELGMTVNAVYLVGQDKRTQFDWRKSIDVNTSIELRLFPCLDLNPQSGK